MPNKNGAYTRIFRIFLFLFTSMIIHTNSFAQEEFSIDYNLDYKIQGNGETIINHQAEITNLRNDVIPTTYTFSTQQLKIYDVTAETNGKKSGPKNETKGEDTIVSVVIVDYAIGEGRRNKINLDYKTKDIAKKSGLVWNIFIPQIQIPEKTTMYNIKISVPKSFGPKIFLSPTPVIEKTEDDSYTYYFTKESLQSSGIIATFGDLQPVNFKLKYQLKNSSILPSIKEIALPPDIKNSQNVSYKKLTPEPVKVRLDKDGNILASYILGPKKELEVDVIGTARIYGKQINPDSGKGFQEIPKEISKRYTKAQKFWEVDSPYIKELSSKIKDENINVVKNAKKIYDFIVKNIQYDFEAVEKGMVERKGAEITISQEGKWTCMEFTDLFIATARAMGIPAREINGYAFTFDDENTPISINLKGGDFLHSWAEFYDPFYGWVQIDPTWGATSGLDYFTKLDTNHLAFVIKGIDSEYPYAAGTYRFSENDKLIETALAQSTSDDDFYPKLTSKKVFNINPIKLMKKNIRVKVTNTGLVSAYNIDGKIVPPLGNIYIYMDRSTENINYEDFSGNKYNSAIEK